MSNSGSGTGRYPLNDDIRDKGASTALADNSPAFALAMHDAKNSSAAIPFGLSSDPHSSVVVNIPAGVFTVAQVNALIGSEGMSAKSVGLKIKGAGLGLTSIIFNPGSAGALNFNDYWLAIQFEGIDFYANTAGCTFLQSYTTHNAQRYSFSHCSFNNFRYVIDLQGNNNNSEFLFLYCHANGIASKETDTTNGAFFHIGATNTSDQFLNYWFYGCTHWSSSAPYIDAAMGGSFHIFGLDCSAWGSNIIAGTTANTALFNLRGYSHSYGVQNFNANGVRVEAKSTTAALLYSEWPGGSVAFRNVDWSSQVNNYTYGTVITINYVNTEGAIYSFEDSVLAGGVAIGFSINDWQHRHAINFTNCQWLQKISPSDVVTYNLPGVNPQATPAVIFTRCRGTQNDATVSAGAVAWDATIGYNGELLQTFQKRELSLRGVNGLHTSGSMYARLPIGALITSIQILSPAGAVTAVNTNGSYTLATTEATPTTIGTVAITTAQNAGFSVETVLSVPFRCANAQQATVSLTPTNISQNNSQGLFLIKGYW